MRFAPIPFAILTAAALAVATSPAGALDDAKPVACNGFAYTDPAGDNTIDTVPTPGKGTDALGGFIKHDPAKGDEATTYNLVIKDLDPTVPPGYTTISWTMYYPVGNVNSWVRAVSDFGGGVAFEYGHVMTLGTPPATRDVSIYDGDSPGKLFEGADGVVQVVIPKANVKAGDTLKPVYTVVGQGQASLPASSGAPTRGLVTVMDQAPDDAAAGGKSETVEPCPAEGAAPGPAPVPVPVPTVAPAPAPIGGGDPSPAPAPAPPPAPPTTATPTGSRALPVTLVTKSAKSKKVRKSLALKLRTSERITNLAGQLRKGNKLAGSGKLGTLDGAGTLKLKLAKRKKGKKLAKGAYVLDLVGTDSSGKRLLVSYRLKIK